MKMIWVVIIAPTLITGEPVNPSDKPIKVEEDTGRLLKANHKARFATEDEVEEAEAKAKEEAEAKAKEEAEAKAKDGSKKK